MLQVNTTAQVSPFNATHGHASVSEKYCFVDTKEVISMFEGIGFSEVSRKTTRSQKYNGFQKHITVLRPEGEIHGDSMPSIFIRNAHKSGALVISLGYFRMCCENQLPFAIAEFTFKFSHVGDVMDKVRTILCQIRQKIEELKLERDALVATKVTEEMKLALVATLNEQRPTSAKVTSENIFAARREEDEEQNLWTLMNVVQEFAVRGGNGVRALRSENSIYRVSAALTETAHRLAA